MALPKSTAKQVEKIDSSNMVNKSKLSSSQGFRLTGTNHSLYRNEQVYSKDLVVKSIKMFEFPVSPNGSQSRTSVTINHMAKPR